jgi:hypothetical protein
MNTKAFFAAATACLLLAGSAYAGKPPKAPDPSTGPPAPTLPACANTDVQFGMTFATDCAGFYDKNTIQGMIDAEDLGYLALLTPAPTGLVDGGAFLVKLEGLSGATDLTFTGFTFYGLTYFGLHSGGGGDRPGVNSSAYYVVDYGTVGGNTLHLNLNASSNIAVYKTGPKATPFIVVPEPTTWAMMIIGFGGVGGLLRRRRPAVA